MSVLIGNASIDENGNISGGEPGDQNGKEVVKREWYEYNWTAVVRPKSKLIAESIARTMEEACENDNIGYSQTQRTTLYIEAMQVNFDLSRIKNKCSCDCSSLVAVCVIASGITVSPNMYTGNEIKALEQTGYFDVIREKDYTTKSSFLKRGDILVRENYHTAVVLSDGSKVYVNDDKQTIKPAKSFNKDLAGVYRATTSVYVRCGAGKTFKALNIIKEGNVCRCYGYYTNSNGTRWLYIQRGHIEGFVSSRYLKKE